MNKLSELTLVLLTYGRHEYVLRQIGFWSDTPVKLQVLDGSEQPCEEAARLCSTGSMVYHHMPLSVYERFVRAIDLIDTPYAVFLGDDEFYIPSALCACMREIEREDLVACGGLALAFYHEGGRVYGRKRFFEMRGLRNESPEAGDRLMKSVTPPLPSVIYAVHRSEVFKNNLKVFRGFKSSCPGTTEVQFTLLTCLQGNTRIIDQLSWLRSCENSSVSVAGWDTRYHLHQWYRDSAKKDEVQAFFKAMLDVVGECMPELDLTETRRLLRTAVDRYALNKKEVKDNMKKAGLITRCGMTAAKYLPSAVTQSLRPIYDRTMAKYRYDHHKEFKPISVAAHEMADEGITVDFEQLEKIVSRICLFHAASAQGDEPLSA